LLLFFRKEGLVFLCSYVVRRPGLPGAACAGYGRGVENDSALLELAAGLAWRAAELILGIRARGFSTSQKDDRSPVTEADHQAEALIVAGLREATPQIAVVAEEEISGGHIPRPGRATWFVDPLDGTRDFAAGRDSFCVNIGLVRDAVPVLGVVALPATAELFGGIVGVGAWKQDRGPRRPIHAVAPPATGLRVLASRHYADDPRLAEYLRSRPVAGVTHLGSAVKMCRVAEGAADLYPRFGRTMEWDTAGPQAVLEAAGGSLTLLDGTALRYGKPGWANGGFVAQGLG
jgi:3'(2'), 5'-bisphosphate nucleotidase